LSAGSGVDIGYTWQVGDDGDAATENASLYDAASGIGDYTLIGDGVRTIEKYTNSDDIQIVIKGDNYAEVNKNLRLVIDQQDDPVDGGEGDYSNDGANMTHDITITNDDADPTAKILDGDATQDQAMSGAESTTSVNFTIQLDAPSLKTTTVAYALSGGTASATAGSSNDDPDDFDFTNGTVSFSALDTEEIITLTIHDDAVYEDNETVVLSVISSGTSNAAVGAGLTYTIIEEADPPTISFSSSSNGASGRDEANETVQIALASNAYSDQLMQIDYVVTGTATSGTDYTLNNGVASVAIGANSGTIDLEVSEDIWDEEDIETVIITLQDATGDVDADGNPYNTTRHASNFVYTHNIADDDDPPTMYFDPTSGSHAENGGAVSMTVKLDQPSQKTVTASVGIKASSTNAEAADYTGPLSAEGNTTVTFPALNQSQTVTLTPNASDQIDEANETIVVELTGIAAGNGTVPSDGSDEYTITLEDSDSPPAIGFDTSGDDDGIANQIKKSEGDTYAP